MSEQTDEFKNSSVKTKQQNKQKHYTQTCAWPHNGDKHHKDGIFVTSQNKIRIFPNIAIG